MLANRDAHEYGDHALTKYYDASNPEQGGVGYAWIELSDQLPAPACRSLLGEPIGPRHNLFDPGRMGSYFQTPEQVRVSLKILGGLNMPEIKRFCKLLSRCAVENLGVYNTF